MSSDLQQVPTTQWADLVSKIMLAVLTLVIIPTFGWVWKAESRVSTLENKLEVAAHEISTMRTNSTNIQLIQKDIEHINIKLGEIARLIENKRPN